MMTRLGRVRQVAGLTLALTALLAMTPRSAAGQEVDVSALGPRVGERLPDFTMTDQNGDEQTLGSVMGPNGAVIVLFRSADW